MTDLPTLRAGCRRGEMHNGMRPCPFGWWHDATHIVRLMGRREGFFRRKEYRRIACDCGIQTRWYDAGNPSQIRLMYARWNYRPSLDAALAALQENGGRNG